MRNREKTIVGFIAGNLRMSDSAAKKENLVGFRSV